MNLTTINNALKDVYLDIIADKLNNNINPFFAKVGHTSDSVWGKEIVRNCTGKEDGIVRVRLKNIYSTIELPDKLIEVSQSNVGEFVNLLNAEIDGLLQVSKFNIGRMLFGDSSGVLAKCDRGGFSNYVIQLHDARNVIEGMVIDIFDKDDNLLYTNVKIRNIDRGNNKIALNIPVTNIKDTDYIALQDSRNNELTGLRSIFSCNDIYGSSRTSKSWLKPQRFISAVSINENTIRLAIEDVEKTAGGEIDFILVSYNIRRLYIEHLKLKGKSIDYITLDNGYKALSFDGIPLVADRFMPDGTIYLLNSSDFKIHQLCDWNYIEDEAGCVLHRDSDKDRWHITLVKYAELLCDCPMRQAYITGVTGWKNEG